MVLAIFALAALIWFVGIFYLVKWLIGPKREPSAKKKDTPPVHPVDVEIPIEEVVLSPRQDDGPSLTYTDIDDFYRNFGRSNIIEFPAEYSGENTIIGLNRERQGIIEFVKDCYSQIGFRCIETLDFLGHPSSHPSIASMDITPLVGRYQTLPQLIVWNDWELFFVIIKSRYEILTKDEMDFLSECVIKKGLFKAKIFKVTQRQRISQSVNA